jgi:hypothetical protein
MRLPLIGQTVWDRAVIAERKRITKALEALGYTAGRNPDIHAAINEEET